MRVSARARARASVRARTSVSSATPIPTIDLHPWVEGGPETRRRIARTVDEALQTAGFLLVTGHGVGPALRGLLLKKAIALLRPCATSGR